jgi:hypothetical protein
MLSRVRNSENPVFDLEIKDSAYKHGYSYNDIVNCYRFPIATKVLSADLSKYLYIGFDLKDNPMEILVNHNGISVVFHAMVLRKAFERLINGK